MLTIWLIHVVIQNVFQRGDVIFKITTIIIDRLSLMAVFATLINLLLDSFFFLFHANRRSKHKEHKHKHREKDRSRPRSQSHVCHKKAAGAASTTIPQQPAQCNQSVCKSAMVFILNY